MKANATRMPASIGTPRRALRRAVGVVLATVPLVLAGCGGGGTSPTTASSATSATSSTSTISTASTTTSSTSSTTATPQPGPAIALIWVVSTPTGAQIRQAAPGGGPAHTIATLAPDDHVIADGSGRVVVATATHRFKVINVADGSSTVVGSFGGVFLEAAAMSPDGTKLVYLDSTNGLSGSLKNVDLASGSSTTLRAFPSNKLDVPSTWSDAGIGATDIVGASDAPPQGALTLNPASGARVASTSLANLAAVALTADSTHAALVLHSALGDEGDFAGGPGPMGPFNTLKLATIGGSVATLLQEAHHDITVLASLPAGDRVLIHDGSAAGGFAGITLSPDFGLMAVTSAGAKTQYAKENGTQYDGGVFLQDGTTVAVSSHTSTSEKLVQFAPGTTPTTLDTVPGGQFASVLLVPR